MSIVLYLSDKTSKKLRAIAKTMVGRDALDLAQCAIDEAIIDWERNNSHKNQCTYCLEIFDAKKQGGGHLDDCPEKIPF